LYLFIVCFASKILRLSLRLLDAPPNRPPIKPPIPPINPPSTVPTPGTTEPTAAPNAAPEPAVFSVLLVFYLPNSDN